MTDAQAWLEADRRVKTAELFERLRQAERDAGGPRISFAEAMGNCERALDEALGVFVIDDDHEPDYSEVNDAETGCVFGTDPA